MSDWDVTPRAARRLRTFGRPDAPSDLHRGSGPIAPEPVADQEVGTEQATHTSIWDRRKPSRPDPEAIDIALESSHAWWAQRDHLELLVNPKPRGAAARAKRAAEAAFAPPGARTTAPRAGPAASSSPSGSAWDPSQVYSWAPADPPTADPGDEPARPEPTVSKTPWDILGLTSDATWPEVARRHKQLAKQHHPDRHGTSDRESRRRAESRMSEINAAFSDLRRIYQLTGGL
jgi:hypothetical protein